MKLPVFLVGIIALAGGLGMAVGTLHYQGMCISQGRIIPESEKIERIVEDVNNAPTIRVEVPIVDAKGVHKSLMKYYKQIKYPSVADFISQNPGCCELHIYQTYNNQKRYTDSTFWARVIGVYSGETWIKYNAHYIDVEGKDKQLQTEVFRAINNCGYVDKD